jgi:ribonucleoside-diphosphate reductase alpha chain
LPDAVAKAIGMHFGLLGFHNEVNKKIKEPVQQLLAGDSPVLEPTANGHTQIPLFKKRADLCPKCGEASLVFEEGCKKCYACGYSEC